MSGRGLVCTLASSLIIAGSANGQTIYNSTPEWISTDTQYSTGAALVDLDRDGWLDLVVANGNDMATEYLVVYYNQQDGTFPPTPDWQSADQAYNGHLAVADVNGDGWPDVAVARLVESASGSSAAKLYLNNSGTLSSQPDWTSSESARAFGVAFGDVNNDGRPDLAVATGWPYSAEGYYYNYLYLNVGGALSEVASWESGDLNRDLGVVWTDADNDGWLDLLFAGRGDTRVYRNLGGTIDTTPIWLSTDNPNQYAIMATVGDIDADGFRELFVTDNIQLSGGSGLFRQYAGLPGGYFTQLPIWDYYGGYGSAVALADVDNDSDLDLATGAWWDFTLLFVNDGQGYGSSPQWSSQFTSVVEKIVFGDIDPACSIERTVVESFQPEGDRRLFHLARQQIQQATSVILDGQVLTPSQYTADREHGWLTITSAPLISLEVHYTYSVSLDMAITNWDPSLGNYVYYNQLIEDCNNNGVPDGCDIADGTSQDCQPNGIPDECEGGPWYYGDVDGNGDVNLSDLLCMLDGLRGIFSCPGVTFEDLDIYPCEVGDDGDLNLMDLTALLDALAGLPPCPAPCPANL